VNSGQIAKLNIVKTSNANAKFNRRIQKQTNSSTFKAAKFQG
jgi:hypothetical protein